MADEFVKVYENTDPVEAEMLEDLLRSEGLTVRLLGTRQAALIGIAQSILPLRLEVPADESAEARRLLEAFDGESATLLEDVDGLGPDDPDDAEEERLASPPATPLSRRPASQRSPIMAAGMTFIVPGGCHFYAKSTAAGALFAFGWVATFAAMMASPDAAWGIPVLLLADLVGGVRAVRAYNEGGRPGIGAQLVRGGAWVLVALAVGVAGVAIPPMLARWQHARLMRSIHMDCTPSSLTVTNQTNSPLWVWLVEVKRRGEVATLFDPPSVLPAPVHGLRLDPGQPRRVALSPPPRPPFLSWADGPGAPGGRQDSAGRTDLRVHLRYALQSTPKPERVHRLTCVPSRPSE